MYGVYHRTAEADTPDLGLGRLFAEGPCRLFVPPSARPRYRTYQTPAWFGACFGEVVAGPPIVAEEPAAAQSGGDVATAVKSGDTRSLASLNGSFLIMLYDRALRELYVISDRCATRRLFYLDTPQRCWFAPAAVFFKQLGASLDTDPQLAAEFLAFRYVVSERTFLSGVKPFPPATVMRVMTSGVETERYWDWQFPTDGRPGVPSAGVDSCARVMGDRLKQAVDRRLRGTDRVAILLSGGFDSRAILGAALQCRRARDIVTATYGSERTLDYEIGNRLAARVGTRHVSLPIHAELDWAREFGRHTQEMDGTVEPFFQAFLELYDRLAEESDFILSGYLGETVTGAHIPPRELQPADGPGARRRAYAVLLQKQSLLEPRIVAELTNRDEDDVRDGLLACVEETSRGNPHADFENWCDWWDLRYRQWRYIIPAVFKLRDRLDYAAPFTDNDFADYCLGLGTELRQGQRAYRAMLAREFPWLFSFPVKNNAGAPLRPTLPYRLAWKAARTLGTRLTEPEFSAKRFRLELGPKPRLNTIDVGDWIRRPSPFADYFRGLIEGVCRRDVVNAGAAGKLLEEHCNGRCEQTNPLVCLAALELAYRHFSSD